MPTNPYEPPQSEVAPPIQRALPWHALLLLVILVVAGAWSLVGHALALAAVGTDSVPLGYFYLFTSVPLLTLLSGYLLWRQSHWVLALLALAALARLVIDLQFRPRASVLSTGTLAGDLANGVSPSSLAWALFFAACFVHVAFLKKWGHIR